MNLLGLYRRHQVFIVVLKSIVVALLINGVVARQSLAQDAIVQSPGVTLPRVDYLVVNEDGLLVSKLNSTAGGSMTFSTAQGSTFDAYKQADPVEFFVLQGEDDDGELDQVANIATFVQKSFVGTAPMVIGTDSIAWEGRYEDSNGAKNREVILRQTLRLSEDDCYVQANLELENKGKPLRNLYFARGGDPDHGGVNPSTQPGADPNLGATVNDVLAQANIARHSLVIATAGQDENGVVPPRIQASFGMGAFDFDPGATGSVRSRAHVQPFFANGSNIPQLSDLWQSPTDPNGGAPAERLTTLIFNIGDLATDEVLRFSYFYVWGTTTEEAEQCFLKLFCKDPRASLDDVCPDIDGAFCQLERCDANAGTATGMCVADPSGDPCVPDGLACGNLSCNEATDRCDGTIDPGFCFIDSVCYSDGEANPADMCLECQADQDQRQWSSLSPLPDACVPTTNPTTTGDDPDGSDPDSSDLTSGLSMDVDATATGDGPFDCDNSIMSGRTRLSLIAMVALIWAGLWWRRRRMSSD